MNVQHKYSGGKKKEKKKLSKKMYFVFFLRGLLNALSFHYKIQKIFFCALCVYSEGCLLPEF